MVFIALGSNLGDSISLLSEARRRLSEALNRELSCSEVIETEAVGFCGASFLNQIVAFEQQDVEPYSLLDICQKIEIEMGRPHHNVEYDKDGKRIYHDRSIDIDILSVNDIRISTQRLTLPHPQCYEREYIRKIADTMEEKDIFYRQLLFL